MPLNESDKGFRSAWPSRHQDSRRYSSTLSASRDIKTSCRRVSKSSERKSTVILCPNTVKAPGLHPMIRCVSELGLLTAVFAAGCSKSNSSSVLGDAAHPAPVQLYTVAEETTQRRIQAVGSLYALEESILSSEVRALFPRCWQMWAIR